MILTHDWHKCRVCLRFRRLSTKVSRLKLNTDFVVDIISMYICAPSRSSIHLEITRKALGWWISGRRGNEAARQSFNLSHKHSQHIHHTARAQKSMPRAAPGPRRRHNSLDYFVSAAATARTHTHVCSSAFFFALNFRPRLLFISSLFFHCLYLFALHSYMYALCFYPLRSRLLFN